MTLKSVTKTIILILSISFPLFAEPLDEVNYAKKITKVVLEHFPDAEISKEDGTLIAKHGTMMFTVHGRSKTGEVSEKTWQREGPNYKGFIITYKIKDGTYMGAAAVPQELNQIYWKEYIDRPHTEDKKSYHFINFAYGVRTSEEFKKAIFEVLPKPDMARDR